MWFVYYYVISTVICIMVMEIMARAIVAIMKREGYKHTRKTTLAERAGAWMPMLIPFINVIIILILILNQQDFYKNSILKMLKNGDIKKIDKE